MSLIDMEKKLKELEKKAAQVQAQREVNIVELDKIKEDIKKQTGLKTLDKLDEYMSQLEENLHSQKNKLAEELAEYEANLVDVIGKEYSSDTLGEELDEI